MCVSVDSCSSAESIFLFGDDSICNDKSSLRKGTQNCGLAFSSTLTPFSAHPRISENSGTTFWRLFR